MRKTKKMNVFLGYVIRRQEGSEASSKFLQKYGKKTFGIKWHNKREKLKIESNIVM